MTPRSFYMISAILLGMGLVLELLGISTFRYGFLFAGLAVFVAGHAV